MAIAPPQANRVFSGVSNSALRGSRYPRWMPMPWKFMPPPAEFMSLPSQENIFAVVAWHSRCAIGATSSRRNNGSTRMSLFKNTNTSAVFASVAPWLQPAAKPTFFSFTTRRTQPCFARISSTEPSLEALSIRITSKRSFG